ncbi:DUF3732 domain-containing protein [Salmonella enterica]|uniref:DUF3732 domain-containing protein n=1 Tax=Enterobacter hormaechei TaxID=158836 RepID=UPI000E3CB2F4|nr:DUF3732 domain-containing protein [Salmonella enterica]MBZ7254359.1 DUF3732 domain-containing protein [Klebsiella oxytoca]HAV1914010.1 DUF3732 domain-containing protein [Enterobacter hormaechei subsp. steigerwaltii]HBQ5902587.1 DUF3732 domain-containing protein [Klebsiella pneumoniae subsp. pneumoniae]HBZ7962155.1 DUF3732 domain-containing protein [Klebsiella pneumoniae]
MGTKWINAVNQSFCLISHAVQTLTPDLYIIVMGHADLKDDWFQAVLSERWRNGVKLIPPRWIASWKK